MIRPASPTKLSVGLLVCLQQATSRQVRQEAHSRPKPSTFLPSKGLASSKLLGKLAVTAWLGGRANAGQCAALMIGPSVPSHRPLLVGPYGARSCCFACAAAEGSLCKPTVLPRLHPVAGPGVARKLQPLRMALDVASYPT